VANITFVAVSDAAQAQITFTRDSDGGASTSRTISNVTGGALTYGSILSTMETATISIDTSTAGFGPIDGSFSSYGGYPMMTFLHEEGHALGLGHAGPYNSKVDVTTQQYSAYDTWLYSIMSYINPTKSSAEYYSSYPVANTYWGYSNGYANVPTTWMPLDILAIEALYGTPTSTPLSGGQVFGFHCNINGAIEPFFDFTINSNPVITIWDQGTGNTLDLSGFSTASTVNLNPGTYSSVDQMVNNIAIAFNTAVDTLVLGSGGGTVTCNNNGDTIYCGTGSVTIIGGAGDDTLEWGTGAGTINGGGGLNNIIISGTRSQYSWFKNTDGSYSFRNPNAYGSTLTHIQKLSFSDQTVWIGTVAANDFAGSGNSAILWQNDSGQAAIWTMNGLVQSDGNLVGGNPGPSWHVVGSGDFFGDGTADILWQNDDGSVVAWKINGLNQTDSSYVGGNPGTTWHVKAIGDFNGDGKSDILWQNDNGQAAVWEMNGYAVASGGYVGGNPGTSWHIVGTGDFNGDGKSDIVWQNDNGQAAIWTMDGLNQTASYLVGGNPGPTWHIKGVGDFYGTGQADILWQNDDGQAVLWTMDGTAQVSSNFVGGNPGPTWHIVGTGDYNADGCADILWQNDNGQAAVWTMNGVAQLGGSLVGGNPGTSWHIPTGVG